MKTQLLNTRSITTIGALLLVAITSTEAAAQRREQNNTRENIAKVTGEVNKKAATKSAAQREYTRGENKVTSHREGVSDNVRPKGTNRRSDDSANNHRDNERNRDNHHDGWKDNHHHGNHHNDYNHWYPAPTPGFEVYMTPRHVHERDYLWHHHKHVKFRTLPRKAVWVVIDGENYALYRGKFYQPGPFGYYRVSPPVYLRHLPENCMQVNIDGSPCWRLHNIVFIETPFGFRIIS
jgi:hypothetical protein